MPSQTTANATEGMKNIERTGLRETNSEATSGRLLVMQEGSICEERSDELKESLEERRYGMLFILSLRFSAMSLVI